MKYVFGSTAAVIKETAGKMLVPEMARCVLSKISLWGD